MAGRGLRLSSAGLLICMANLAVALLHMRPLPPPRLQSCPDACHETGTDPANWTVFAEFDQLRACHRPILLDFSLDIPTHEKQYIRTCDTWGEYYHHMPAPDSGTASDEATVQVLPQLAWSAAGGSKSERAGSRAVMAVEEVDRYLHRAAMQWNKKTILFAAFGVVKVGVYIGENMFNPSVADALLAPFVDKIRAVGIGSSKSAILQVCGQNRTSDLTFGIIAAVSKNTDPVQSAVSSWVDAKCVDTLDYADSSDMKPISIRATPLPAVSTLRDKTTNTPRLIARSGCRTTQVVSGDSCAALASRCAITLSDFANFNPDSKLCSTLKPGQNVCCSSGNLPDFTPNASPDGSCTVYETKSGDSCDSIAAANSLDIKDIEALNKQTWGWSGCDSLWVGIRMCLSKGDPPMPAPMSNAVCGPQKPATPAPPKGANISELNPCPLNACCNTWGQCGTTEDFCTNTREGAPGTAKKGTYGCISNCGMDISPTAAWTFPPAQFIKLGYFEAFNLNRDCQNMDVSQIDPSYTHVHFAFGMLKDDFSVYLEDAYATYEFEQFKKLRGPKRILSFGGWTFSAERPYYGIFRNGVKVANRDKLASSIAKFVNDAGIDGVDIDWEYPGAPDIPGIPPPDDPNEGLSYAAFLRVLRTKLNPEKSLSIAAPASYWYLKQFPISDISKIVDYIVYMTYDLHGQWDATNNNAEIEEIAAGSGARLWYDHDSNSDIMTYGGDSWVAYMGDDVRTSRIRRYQGYSMGGTANWAVDLDKFYSPPDVIGDGSTMLTWAQIKSNIKATGDPEACNKALRSGNWDLASVNNCEPDQQCSAHHSSLDIKDHWTGAGAYLVWNSLAQVNALIKNFHEALEKAAQQVQNKKNEFIDTFAPEGHNPDLALGLSILLTLLQIPSTTLGTLFWKGVMKELDFFRDKALHLDLAKDTSQAMVMAGYHIRLVEISSSAFAKETAAKEVTFNYIFDNLIGTWTEQLDTMVLQLFNGSLESIKQLDAMMGQGQMVPGGRDGQAGPSETNHTASFLNEQTGERAFYAAAIPSIWKMRKPFAQFPVILDFGPDCNRDIGSGPFFNQGEDFNTGWICLNDHNYILASTYDLDNHGPNCSPEYWAWCNNPSPGWGPLYTLPGLKTIREKNKKYADVTVEDLVAGSVASWRRAGKLNIIDDKTPLINPMNRDDFDNLWENDIRAPGNIRIPVCNPHEASLMATDGTKHGMPDGDKASFPCLRDPSKRYDSEWIAWPDQWDDMS
ncbi:chitinase [Bombardia bombarda]|uniref:chitinase n=1 Tax=Bombardia bombarda TaxID=252184 RepID=A0AA40C4K5_9PEZI|nr:chitinase [Bombardia bombarda]